MQNEISSLTRRRGQLEDELLEAMVYGEDAETTLTSRQEALFEIDAQWQAEQAAFRQELSELEVNHKKLMAQTRQFSSFIDEHVLWIRSADTLRPRDATLALRALFGLGQPGQWLEAASSCGLDAVQHAASNGPGGRASRQEQARMGMARRMARSVPNDASRRGIRRGRRDPWSNGRWVSGAVEGAVAPLLDD